MSDLEDALNNILSSPKELEKLMGLARQLSGGANAAPDHPNSQKAPPPPQNRPPEKGGASMPGPGALGGLDPRILGILSRVMGEYSASQKNNKAALLNSIKPYLRQERRNDLDRAIEIARLARVAKMALGEFSGGKANV